MTFHEQAMQQALLEAQRALEEGEVPIGAVITQEERIIARGHNQTLRLKDPTAHAEMLAISAACNTLGTHLLSRCTLYVTLEPCPMCAGALLWAQMGTIYYAGKDSKRGYTCYTPTLLHKRTAVYSGLLEAESLALLQNFFRARR